MSGGTILILISCIVVFGLGYGLRALISLRRRKTGRADEVLGMRFAPGRRAAGLSVAHVEKLRLATALAVSLCAKLSGGNSGGKAHSRCADGL